MALNAPHDPHTVPDDFPVRYDPAAIWDDAIALVASTSQRWGGVAPKVARLAPAGPLPAGDLILLGTPETSRAIARLAGQTDSPVARVPFIAPHGFAVAAWEEGGAKRLVIAGKSPRGAANGAVYCRDFLLEATPGEAGRADVFARPAPVVRRRLIADTRELYRQAVPGPRLWEGEI